MLILIGCFATPTTTPSSTQTNGTYSGANVQPRDAPFRSRVLSLTIRAGYVDSAAMPANATREHGTNRAAVTTITIPAIARHRTSALHLYYPSVNETISNRQNSRSSRHHQSVPPLASHDSTSPNRRRDGANQRDHLPICRHSHNQHHPPKTYHTRLHRRTCYRYPTNLRSPRRSLRTKGHHHTHRSRHDHYRVATCRISMRMGVPRSPCQIKHKHGARC